MTTMVREVYLALKAANVDETLAVDAASAVGERAELATKSDLALHSAALREDMAELRADLRREMAELKTELRGEMAALRAEVHRDLGNLKADMFRWCAAAMLAQAGLIVALVKLIP